MTLRLGMLSIAAIVILISLDFDGCGRGYVAPPPAPPPEPVVPSGLTQVVGKAQFGSQCPLGFYAPPSQAPLELWTCPIGLDPVVLEEPLNPLVLQVDCKKKTMDIRGMERSSQSSTWEIMPDGSFFFRVNGGVAKLKSDGTGHKNCSIPLFANLWGNVDCKARDQAVVQLEAIWWLGSQPEEASPLPSPSMSGLPSPSPSAVPSSVPSHIPSPNPSLGTSRIDSPIAPSGTSVGTSSEPSCQVPVGCFFYSSAQVNQCL